MMVKKNDFVKNFSLIVNIFLLVFFQQANVLIYLTNKTRMGTSPVLVFFAIFLPLIAVLILLLEKFYKDKFKNIFVVIVKEYLPYLIMTFSFVCIFTSQLYAIPKVRGKSMDNTLKDGHRVLLAKYNAQNNITNGSIVVVKTTKHEQIIKRCVAKQGDLIYFDMVSENHFRICIYQKDRNWEPYVFRAYNNVDSEPKFIKKHIGIIKNIEKQYYDDFLHIPSDMKIENADKSLFKYFSKEYLEAKHALIIPKDKFLLIGDNYNLSRDSRVYGLFDTYTIVGHVVIK